MGDRRRAVITGLGAITALGPDVPTFWAAALAGKSGVSTLTNWDTTGHSVTIGGEIKNFDPTQWMEVKEARRLDRFAQFALVSCQQAVEDSGIDFGALDPFRAGAIIGSGIGGITEMQAQALRLLRGGPSKVSPFLIPKLMTNGASGHVAIRYGLRGPNMDVTTACASATHAIGESLTAIRRGAADVLVTGGAEAALTSLGLAGFANMKALSTRNDDPEGASRPFDKDRDGFVVGEGAGALVLEELEHAKRRGATLYVEVAGYSATCDAYHITAPDPEGAVAARTMQLARACSRELRRRPSSASSASSPPARLCP